MAFGGERKAVQDPLLRYAEEAGWTRLSPEDAVRLRGGNTGLILSDVFTEQIQKLNPGVVDRHKAEEVAKRLKTVSPSIEGNLDVWEYLKGLKTVFIEAERRDRNVRFLDPSNVEANAFHVTDELTYVRGRDHIRADVAFFINGIPVVLVEAKAATRRGGMGEALEQVRRYHREGPELLALAQLFNITNLAQFKYGATWSLSRKTLFDWRDERAGDFESLVKTFFAPRRVMRVITDFVLFTRKDEELQKVVLRPHQMRAVERVQKRAAEPEKHSGLVWHTQGSGKTFTMITAAKRLMEEKAFQNPTVLMLVDRNELEAQLSGNLESVGITNAEVARSKRHLVRLLKEDRRGLIVSMIHKFDEIPEKVNTRENFFVLVDEAHRTTGGNLGNYLTGAIPNATFIGFTGTPIDKTAHGQGTFKTFGSEDERGYLDKYSIKESIEDGTTVPLHYALAPNDLLVDRETLEREFLDLAVLEGVSDVEELNRVLERAVNLKNLLKNPDRVAKVAEYVAKHFKETVEPTGYKAFIVAPDREGCTLYKRELDKHLPPEWSEVVMSVGHNDPPELAEFHLSADEEKRVRKSFRKPDEEPKILIVTEKLLTGYDAPILYSLYLDKPMRDHVLLQAIARVNRPFEDAEGRRKPSGFVLDFVGVFDNLEKALAFDSEEVSGVVEGMEVLQKRFEDLMERGREEYLSIPAGKNADKAAEAVLEHFRDEDAREEFYAFFRDVEEIYEILSPAPELRPYVEDFEALAEMYRLLRTAYESHVSVDRSFLRKTAKLVQEHTTTPLVRGPEHEHELTPEALRNLAEKDQSDAVKVFNMLIAIRKLVEEKVEEMPYLASIGERAEAIAEAFEQHFKDAHESLLDLLEAVEELDRAEGRRKESDLADEPFAVYVLLENRKVEKAEEIAGEVSSAFEDNPHWKTSDEQEKHIRFALYKALNEAGEKDRMFDLVGHILDLMRSSRR
jgi:type I restriction enzyme, R subunit